MFDSLHHLDAAAAAAAVSRAHALRVEQDCLLFGLAAHWVDLHSPGGLPGGGQMLPGAERGVLIGGAGTPEVAEFACAELGTRLGTTSGSARALMADAIDTRHRLPRLWRLVQDGGVSVGRVRQIAQATRHLNVEAAGRVDAELVEIVGGLSWARYDLVLEAAIIRADPALADQQAAVAEAERFVRAGRTQSGLRTVIAKCRSGEVAWFMATVNRIADILAADGDTDTADVRRSRAIGIIAQPEHALRLLMAHADDPSESDQPVEPSSDEPVDPHQSLRMRSPEPVEGRGSFPEPVEGPSSPAGLGRAAAPKVVLYVHIAQEALTSGGVARLEDSGPMTTRQLRRFLADTGCAVRAQPVIDLNTDDAPVDAYEIPDRLRHRIWLRQPGSAFPYSATVSRRVDLDHTVAYRPAGEPGQTRIDNLGPLNRFEHRVKTFSRWQVRQPEPGRYLWRSPHGAHYLVTPTGTQALGDQSFARAIWRAAAPISSHQALTRAARSIGPPLTLVPG